VHRNFDGKTSMKNQRKRRKEKDSGVLQEKKCGKKSKRIKMKV